MGNSRSGEVFIDQENPSRKVFVRFESFRESWKADYIGFKYATFKFVVGYQRYQWYIQKRFHDIVNLDDKLHLKYPHKMENVRRPAKYSKVLYSHDQTLLSNRGKDIVIYLQSIVDDEELFTTNEIQEFLGIGKTTFHPLFGRKGKEGYLKKCSGGYIQNYSTKTGDYFKTWRKRWIVLYDTHITYYKKRSDTVPLGCLHIDQGFDIFLAGKLLTVVTLSRKLVLFAPTLRYAVEWFEDISSFYRHTPRRIFQPFSSSYPSRIHSSVKLYLCGEEYFQAAATAILGAEDEIFLCSWMVSPTLLLVRHPYPPIRLDHLLRLKASQGVKIFVILYKEIELSGLGNDSMKCKTHLENLHPNILCMRHPNKFRGGSTAIFWSHHEKLIIVDRRIAFVGGIDPCFGRWDNKDHILSDIDGFMFPGMDYYQPGRGLFRPLPTEDVSVQSDNMENVQILGSTTQKEEIEPKLSVEYERNLSNESEAQSEISLWLQQTTIDCPAGQVNSNNSSFNEPNGTLSEENMRAISAFETNDRVQQEFQPVVVTYDDSSEVVFPSSHAEESKVAMTSSKPSNFAQNIMNSLAESFVAITDTVNSQIESIKSPTLEVKPKPVREIAPRMPWHDVHAGISGVAVIDLAAHFIQRWNHHRMSKSELNRPILLETSDNPYFSICARCSQKDIHISYTVCPTCKYNLGPSRLPLYSPNDSLTANCTPLLSCITFTCKFNNKIGCIIDGDGPVYVKNILDKSAIEAAVDRKIIQSKGDQAENEFLEALGLIPRIGDIFLSVDQVSVTHMDFDAVQRLIIIGFQRSKSVTVLFRRYHVNTVNEVVDIEKRLSELDIDICNSEKGTSLIGDQLTTELDISNSPNSLSKNSSSNSLQSFPSPINKKLTPQQKKKQDLIAARVELISKLACAAEVQMSITLFQAMVQNKVFGEILPNDFNGKGTCVVQVLRSVGGWAVGHKTECSIYNCWLDAIKAANHFIYIENQFFLSDIGSTDIKNSVAKAILERISNAIMGKEEFKVIIIIPMHPEGDFLSNEGPRVVMHYQYRTICRGFGSLLEQLRKRFPNVDVNNYITFNSLRNWGVIKNKVVFEQVYVHDKLLIVDDRVLIVGSANINDRSMLGDRDTEVVIRIEDTAHVRTTMNRVPWTVGLAPHLFRIRLMRAHVGDDNFDFSDPICTASYKDKWQATAYINSQIYDHLDGPMSVDRVFSLGTYASAISTHEYLNYDNAAVRNCLEKVRGTLVNFPNQFLQHDDLSPSMATRALIPADLFV